jgi:hypothetical protein
MTAPCLNLVTALPLSVWREHLRPLLSVGEVVRLRGACKAMKGMVMGWPMSIPLGGCLYEEALAPKNLEAVLTCFPATESLAIRLKKPLAPAENSKMVELLRGHGGTIKRVTAYEGGAHRVFESAVRAGALPNLTYFSFFLEHHPDREILSGGVLPLLEEVRVRTFEGGHAAALEPLRHLPHLRSLSLMFEGARDATFPPFIPRSLKSLYLDVDDVASFESVLRELPWVSLLWCIFPRREVRRLPESSARARPRSRQ